MRTRALKVLARTAQAAGLSAVFATAAVYGFVLHADLPATRRLVSSIANQALGSVFEGRLVISDVKQMSLGRLGQVRIGQVEIFDPEGQRVILARDIVGRIDLGRLVRSIATGSVPDIALDDARIDNVEVKVDLDARGEVRIARAFQPRPGTTPKIEPPPGALVVEDVRLSIPNAYVRHAWVSGNVLPPNLDADADEIRAHVAIALNRFDLGVTEARLLVRSPKAPGQVGEMHGNGKGTLAVPLSAPPGAVGIAGSGIVMHWELTGDAAGIPIVATYGMAGDQIEASVDVAAVEPGIVKRAFPKLPISRAVTLHATAKGDLQALAITSTAKLGDTSIAATGRIGLRGDQPFNIDADVTSADAAALSGPASDISGHVHAEGTLVNGAPTGTFTVTTKPGTIAKQKSPALEADGRFDERHVTASFRASEAGVTASGNVDLRVPEKKLDFDVTARSTDLRALARAPGMVSGSLNTHAKGTLDLETKLIDANITADATGLARAPASAESVHAEGHMTGPVEAPLIDVTATARQIRLTAKEKEPLVYPSATIHARVALVPSPRVSGVDLRVDGPEGAAPIVVTADEITIAGGGADIRGGRITGLGEPLVVDGRVGPGGIALRAKAEEVDLQRLAALTGIQQLELLPAGTRAKIDIDVSSTAKGADGHVDVTVSSKDGLSGELHAKLDGRHITASATAALAGTGWVTVQRAELDLDGPPSLATFERATGSVNLYGELDLSRGAALFAGESIEKMSGIAIVEARLERGDKHNPPTVFASVKTRGLDVTLNDEGKSTHIGGVDGAMHIAYDGATDDTAAAALVWDAKGMVATTSATARIPLVAWLRGTKVLDARSIQSLEIGGVADIPARDVANLPGIFARPDLRGLLRAHADLHGTIAQPHIELVATGTNLGRKVVERGGGPDPRFAPIDAKLVARWDGENVVATLQVDEDERQRRANPKRKSGHVRGLVIGRFPVNDLLDGVPVRWNASGEVDIADLELAPLPLPMNLRGAVTARVKVRDLQGEPLLQGAGQVLDLGIAGVRVARADMFVEARNGHVDASASVKQADGGSGSVKLTSSSLTWHGTKVDWDDTKASRFEYAVDGMRLNILRPFVRQQIPEIDGLVNGRGSATVDATSQAFEGGLAITKGRLYVNAIGEEITEVGAVAQFERNGVFRVQDARGKIGAGELKASVSGRFSGLRFQSADAVVVVPSKDGVPLSAEGATFAEATGEVRIAARMSPDRSALEVAVTVPRSKITLPDRTTQNLQPLDPDPTIDVGIRQPDGTLTPRVQRPGAARRTKAEAKAAADAAVAAAKVNPNDGIDGIDPTTQPLVSRFTITLGDEVQLEGRSLKLYLGGRTVVELAEEIAVSGQITLRQGGTIDVQGRKFVVDRGTVTFIQGDDPADPIVIAAAYWDAPDRTRVWVEFNGPLKTGKLTLRSEPPYSKNEILSILLFGRADPNQARAGDARPSDAQAATALGSGLASSGLNKALGELDEDFDLEQDRTSANRVRTKVGYRLRRNLKVQLGYAAGFSQREPDTTYLFLEWQFAPKWSLIGTRGDRGTSILDILFQHRY